jgi:hypothetical protein
VPVARAWCVTLAGRPGIRHTWAMLHLMKLAVGVRDVAHLRDLQARRRAADPPLRHLTRSFPRRADEILDGGSIYWVIAGALVVRQRIIDIVADRYDDGSSCAAIHLDAALVTVAGRPTRPFQGWRYLAADAAPRDLDAAEARDAESLPEALRRDLRELGLL